MTHHEKDFTDYIEEAIVKIDAAIEYQYTLMREQKMSVSDTASFLRQTELSQATIRGLEQAKEILLGRG